MGREKFHAEYRSAGPCQKTWISAASESSNFPPQVAYNCDLCSATHNFRLARNYMIATEGQAKRFATYCSNQGMETEVKIT